MWDDRAQYLNTDDSVYSHGKENVTADASEAPECWENKQLCDFPEEFSPVPALIRELKQESEPIDLYSFLV